MLTPHCRYDELIKLCSSNNNINLNRGSKMSSISVTEQQHMMHVMALNYKTKKKANGGTKQTYLPADRQTDRQSDRQSD